MKSKIILIVFFLLAIGAGLLMTKVNVNYDLSVYLPSDSNSKNGLDLLKQEFGDSTYVRIAFDEESITDAIALKATLLETNHVTKILYLDDYLNPTTFGLLLSQSTVEQATTLNGTMTYLLGLGMNYQEAFLTIIDSMPLEIAANFTSSVDSFYHDGESLFYISFDTSSASDETETALKTIQTIFSEEGYTIHTTGAAASTIFTRGTITSEVFKITIIIVPLILIILLFMSQSFFDIVIFGIVAGVAIVLNLGTNAFLPSISFITQSMALALQLAISLDYIIFILNSYHHERNLGNDVTTSIQNAMKKIKKPVIASAMTTIVSFLALIFMRFTIGMDIGIVFAKAVAFSLVSSLLLLPILIKMFSRIIDKTKHKVYLPKFSKFSKLIYKGRFVFLAFLLLIIGPASYFQGHNDFSYGDSALTGSIGSSYQVDTAYIQTNFGKLNQIVILTNKDDILEGMLYAELSSMSFIDRVDAGIYYKTIITDPLVLQAYLANFYSEDYALIQISLNSDTESEEAFAYYEEIKTAVDDVGFSEAYLVGSTPISYDIKNVISLDYMIVTVIALLAIMVIIFLTFKNMVMPFILPLVIEAAVFFTMSIPYFRGQRLVFLGYLIVSTILLGATIDYAILLGKRYIEERENHKKDHSIMNAVSETAPSIVTSALIFATAGFTISFISSIETISQIGIQIAIGALTSLLFVLVILPQLLYIFDKWIIRSHVFADTSQKDIPTEQKE